MARKDQNDGLTVTDADLLPDGADFEPDGDDGDFDINNLRVNFSEKELASEARDFTPLPAGKYHVTMSDVTVERCGPKSKNPGKPYYGIELTVQDGKYEGRKLFTNCMLFSPALYTLVQILKALGLPTDGKVPTPDELQGQHFIVSVKNMVNQYKVEQDGWSPEDGPKPRKNEVGAFFRWTGGASQSAVSPSTGDSMLP
jgi:hypothetical protein